MARHRAPDGVDAPARVDDGGDRPVRPRRRLPLDAVHQADEFLERALIRRPRPRVPREVIELRHDVRFTLAERCIGCGDDRRGREL